MTVTFGFQLHELIAEPVFSSSFPTYEYAHKFDVDYLQSMVAIKLTGVDREAGKKLSQKEIKEDLRVSFKISDATNHTNDTYLDAVNCKDLYED